MTQSNNPNLDEILAKDMATQHTPDGNILMVIMDEGNLDSMIPLKEAIQAYITQVCNDVIGKDEAEVGYGKRDGEYEAIRARNELRTQQRNKYKDLR